MKEFENAKSAYAAMGVDVEKAMDRVSKIPVSVHCWQGDDVKGFLFRSALSGGIQTTGNYPYAAKTPAELMADFDEVLKLVPGLKRISLHAIYAITDEKVDLDKLEYRHLKNGSSTPQTAISKSTSTRRFFRTPWSRTTSLCPRPTKPCAGSGSITSKPAAAFRRRSENVRVRPAFAISGSRTE